MPKAIYSINILCKVRKYFHPILSRNTTQVTNLKPPWKILFFGTDDFAVESLKMLYNEQSSRKLVGDLAVVCSHHRSPVAQFSTKHKIPILRWPPTTEDVIQTGAQIGLVASFGHLISSKIISTFPLGMVNVHASLLPRWRGAAPIVHAVLNRDKVTGITVMRVRPHRFDCGEILGSATCNIDPHETAANLTQRLAVIGASELRKCLENFLASLEAAKPQPSEGVTLAPKIGPTMALCDFHSMTAEEVYARHLAVGHLFPLLVSWQSQPIKILDCQVVDNVSLAPGKLQFEWQGKRLVIGCQNSSAVVVTRLKLANKRPISAFDFYNGYLNKAPKDKWRVSVASET